VFFVGPLVRDGLIPGGAILRPKAWQGVAFSSAWKATWEFALFHHAINPQMSEKGRLITRSP